MGWRTPDQAGGAAPRVLADGLPCTLDARWRTMPGAPLLAGLPAGVGTNGAGLQLTLVDDLGRSSATYLLAPP